MLVPPCAAQALNIEVGPIPAGSPDSVDRLHVQVGRVAAPAKVADRVGAHASDGHLVVVHHLDPQAGQSEDAHQSTHGRIKVPHLPAGNGRLANAQQFGKLPLTEVGHPACPSHKPRHVDLVLDYLGTGHVDTGRVGIDLFGKVVRFTCNVRTVELGQVAAHLVPHADTLPTSSDNSVVLRTVVVSLTSCRTEQRWLGGPLGPGSAPREPRLGPLRQSPTALIHLATQGRRAHRGGRHTGAEGAGWPGAPSES